MKKKSGFTLIEVALAMGLAAIAICGLLATYLSCLFLSSTSKDIHIAAEAAQGLMEQIRTDSFSQIVSDYDGLIFNVTALPTNRGVVYVNDSNPELLNVTISVCWNESGRVMGEDTNLNGVLNAGEDKNNNTIIDSPVQLVTLIANR
jgi:prepilin-type N-terminal cleavage/methylation domain-containing protein